MTPVFSKLTGFALYVQSIALLGAWDAGHLEEGARAWTGDQRDEWALAKNAPAGTVADGITVVAATGAGVGAFWIRQNVSDPYWAYVTTWYVDPVAGSDNATGSTPGTALRTMAELCRRLRFGTSNTAYTINVLNNVPATDIYNPDVRQISGGAGANSSGVVWYVVGQRNVIRSGTTAAGTTQTDPSAAAATAQAQITDAAIGWTASEGGLVVAANGDTAWVLSGKTDVVGSAGRVTDWRTSAFAFSGSPGTGGPGAGSAYNLVSLTTWRAQVQAGSWQTPANASPSFGTFSHVFQNIHFDDLGVQVGPFTGRPTIRFNACKFSNQSTGTSSYGFTNGLSSGARLFIIGSMFQNYDNTFRSCFLGGQGQQITLSGGCGMRFTRLNISGPSSFYLNCLCLQGGYIDYGNNSNLEGGGGLHIASSGNGSWLGVYNDFNVGAGIVAALQLIKPFAQAVLYGSFYGVGDGVTNITGIRCDAGAKCTIKSTITEAAPTPTTAFNFSPSVNGTQLSLDGLSATMPNITASAGAVLPATTDYRTFTLYRTTFARDAQNYGNGSAFLSTTV